MNKIFISHRGNLNGREPERENRISFIDVALKKSFYVEIDVRYCDNKFYLGHDVIQEVLPNNFLMNSRIIFHAKTLITLIKLLAFNTHCFFHDTDDVTLTSRNFLWVHPLTPLSDIPTILNVIVIQVNPKKLSLKADGYCSDEIAEIEKRIR